MSGQATRKQEKDYSPEVKALQPEAEQLAQVRRRSVEMDSKGQVLIVGQNGKLQEAVDKIGALEKQTRNVHLARVFATVVG